MSSLSGEAHPTITAADASARKALVIDGLDQRPNIDVSPVTQCLSPFPNSQNVKEEGAAPSAGKGNKRFLLNDETEQRRLDLQHQIYLTTLDGKLVLAPIHQDIKSALDVAAGTGIWGISFAQQHPNCNVVGIDLEMHKPAYVPPNYTFQAHDPEIPWKMAGAFDYIHGRSLSTRLRNPSLMIEQAFHALAPGSFLELQDFLVPMRSIDSSYANSVAAKWQDLIIEGSAKLGRDLTRVRDYKRLMEERGFVDVVEVHFQWPLGPWAENRKLKAVGVLFREDMVRVIEGLSMRLLGEGLGMSAAEISLLVEDFKRELTEEGVHIYLPIVIVYGKKLE